MKTGNRCEYERIHYGIFTNRTLTGERAWGGRDLLLFLTPKREKIECTVCIAGMEHGKALSWDCTWKTLGNTLKSLTCSSFTGKPALAAFGLSTAVSPHSSPFSRGSTSVRATLSCHSGSPGLFNNLSLQRARPIYFFSMNWILFSGESELALRVNTFLFMRQWMEPRLSLSGYDALCSWPLFQR